MANGGGVNRIVTEYEVVDRASESYRSMTTEAAALSEQVAELTERLDEQEQEMEDLREAAKETEKELDAFKKATSEADAAIGKFGGPAGTLVDSVGGLEKFSKALGISENSLKLLGQAGAVAGAAVAGWKVGRWISDITGLSAAISDATGEMELLIQASDRLRSTQGLIDRINQATGGDATTLNQASLDNQARIKRLQAEQREAEAAAANADIDERFERDMANAEAFAEAEKQRIQESEDAEKAAAEQVHQERLLLLEDYERSLAEATADGMEEGIESPQVSSAMRAMEGRLSDFAAAGVAEGMSFGISVIQGGNLGGAPDPVQELFGELKEAGSEQFTGGISNRISLQRFQFLENLFGSQNEQDIKDFIGVLEGEQRAVRKSATSAQGVRSAQTFANESLGLQIRTLNDLLELLGELKADGGLTPPNVVQLDDASIAKIVSGMGTETTLNR